MRPQCGLLKTVLSFACGFLLGYQIYYVSRVHRKDGPPEDDTDGRSNEFTQLYEAIARIEEQLNQIRRKLEDSEEELANDKANKRSLASSGGVKGVPSCPSTEDIFYDTSDSIEQAPQLIVDNGTCLDNVHNAFYAEVDEALEDGQADRQSIIEKLKRHIATLSNEANFWWRLAKATHFLSKTDFYANEENKEAKKKVLYESFEYAQRALQLDDQNGDCHKWYAIGIGCLSEYVSTKEKVSNGAQFKNHLDMAMTLKKNDSTLYYLAGRFCMELLSLSWIELKVANTFFGPIPCVSHQDALEYFLQAYKLKPAWKENLYYIGHLLLAQKQPDEARKFVDEALSIPVYSCEEEEVHRKLQDMQRQCSR